MALFVSIVLSLVLLASLLWAGFPKKMGEPQQRRHQFTYVGGRNGGPVSITWYPGPNTTLVWVPPDWRPTFKSRPGKQPGQHIVVGYPTTYVLYNNNGHRVTLIRSDTEKLRVYYENHTKRRVLR